MPKRSFVLPSTTDVLQLNQNRGRGLNRQSITAHTPQPLTHASTHSQKGGSESRYSTDFFRPPTEAGARRAHCTLTHAKHRVQPRKVAGPQSNRINQELDQFDQWIDGLFCFDFGFIWDLILHTTSCGRVCYRGDGLQTLCLHRPLARFLTNKRHSGVFVPKRLCQSVLPVPLLRSTKQYFSSYSFRISWTS